MEAPTDSATPSLQRIARLRSLDALASAEQGCMRCALYRDATRAVSGRGARPAPLMLVGEQPGDAEDRAGVPFVGPAGRVLDAALAAAGIDVDAVFVTNAVKHFKFELRGRRRLHKSPAAAEIAACRPWLQRELALVQPRVVVALGASAARALLGRATTLKAERGRLQPFGACRLLVTLHPSWLLRMRDGEQRERERAQFVAELAQAWRQASAV